MAIERRGFNSAIWGTSYNQFFGYPPESFRFIEPYTPHVDALKETQLRNGAQAATESSEKPKYLPLADCAVSHGARCILAAANAIDMGKQINNLININNVVSTNRRGAIRP